MLFRSTWFYIFHPHHKGLFRFHDVTRQQKEEKQLVQEIPLEAGTRGASGIFWCLKMLMMAQIVPWNIAAYRVAFYGRQQKLKSLVPSHASENGNVNGIVNDGGNEELPVAVYHHENCLADPPELPPQVPTDRVEDGVSHHRGDGSVIGFVPNETWLTHAAKLVKIEDYFPMQNFEKMFPNRSSVVISPVISPKWKSAFRMSMATRSPDICLSKP